MLRGGSWSYLPYYIRAADRNKLNLFDNDGLSFIIDFRWGRETSP